MNDYSELERLAAALVAHDKDSFHLPCTVAFERKATPEVVLALIAENKRLAALLECAQGDLKQAMQIIEKDGKDAERYRWLRDPDRCEEDYLDGPADNIVVGFCGGEDVLWSETLDRAIDTVMSKEARHDPA